MECAGMVADVFALVGKPNPASAITVEIVDDSGMNEWANTTVSAWGDSPSTVPLLRDNALRYRKALAGSYFCVLARVDGKPAGAGILSLTRMGGYLVYTAVKKEFRRQGVYRALVMKRLEILAEMGVPLAIIQADITTSAPICARLGFEEVCRIQIYNYGKENYVS